MELDQVKQAIAANQKELERLAPLVKNGKFSASVDYGVLKDVDAVSICVPTPLRKTKDPDMSYVIKAVDSVTAVAHDDMYYLLESPDGSPS